MLRKAEEIAADVFNQWAFSSNERDAMVKVINEARKEAIEAAVEVAKARIIDRKAFVDKQSILDLLNEIK